MIDPPPSSRRRVNAALELAAAYAWRLIVVGVVVVGAVWLIRQLRVVFFAVVVAVLLSRVLSPVVGWLRRHRWRPGFAAVATIVGFFAALAGLTAAMVPTITDELGSIEPTITLALDDVEDWLVEDSPIEVSRSSVERLRERAGEEFDALLRSSDGALADRAALAAEILTGIVVALILTFFMLRDGRRFVDWACRLMPGPREARLRASAEATWSALAGYLRGAALLGFVEAVVIGTTMLLVGSDLVVPVAVITFLAAFVPLVGAIVAGAIAVLVTLATAGTGAAVVVAVVALVVQQLDNDVLAPVIYGRALSLHPVVILVGVVAGGALFGVTGTILAVPVIAVAVTAVTTYRSEAGRPHEGGPEHGRPEQGRAEPG